MATRDEIVAGAHYRHKGGKLYYVEGNRDGSPRWERSWVKSADDGKDVSVVDYTKVWCTQWQVNERYPEGRSYQAARLLKIADLTKV